MKIILVILLLILFNSCDNTRELDGKWVITKMTYNGEEIYPKTISENFRIIANINGYEGAERVQFRVEDSTIVFPGFNTDEIVANFSLSSKKLKTSLNNSNQIPDTSLLRADAIFIQDYDIIDLEHKFKMGLKSQKTKMIIIKESYLIEQQARNLMNNL